MRYQFNSTALAAWALLLSGLLMASGCDCRRDADPRPKSAPDTATAPDDSARTSDTVTASMRVVGLDGQPLPGMTPIATLQPNAFDEPVATGAQTNMNGESSIRFPADVKVALRAWDPNLRYFPNNFYEVLPHTGAVTELLVVSMVEAARLEAVLFLPDGRPVKEENVGLMLFHPAHGPWWPAETNTDDAGRAVFPQVPPGQYVLRLKVASGPAVEMPETFIAPGQSTHLGLVYLQ